MSWHAYQLRPPGSPPIPETYRKRIEAGLPMLIERAREQYGVEVRQGPFEIESRPALIGEKYAWAQGKGNAYHDAVMKAYWQEARDIGKREVLREIAVGVGLDGEAFLAALDEPKYEEEVAGDIEEARIYRFDGVPALVFAEKYLVMGAQPYEVLKRVMERVKAEGGA